MRPCHFQICTKRSEADSPALASLRKKLEENGFIYDELNPDLVLAVGGDGTLMRVIHEHKLRGRFILINSGHLGFYSDYSLDELDSFTEDILHKDPFVEPVPVFSFFINGAEHPFINDVSLQTGNTCFLRLLLNGELLTEARGNGIVISSPIGTTGYLTSLGSPVVTAPLDIYQYSLIAPCYNRLYPNPIRKAIIKGRDVLKVEVLRGPVDVYVDGGKKQFFRGTVYSFQHHRNTTVTFLHLKNKSYTSRLRENISGLSGGENE